MTMHPTHPSSPLEAESVGEAGSEVLPATSRAFCSWVTRLRRRGVQAAAIAVTRAPAARARAADLRASIRPPRSRWVPFRLRISTTWRPVWLTPMASKPTKTLSRTAIDATTACEQPAHLNRYGPEGNAHFALCARSQDVRARPPPFEVPTEGAARHVGFRAASATCDARCQQARAAATSEVKRACTDDPQ